MHCASFLCDLTGQRGDLLLWSKSAVFLLVNTLFAAGLFGVKSMNRVQRAGVRGAMMGLICGQAVIYVLEVSIGPIG